MNSGRQLQPFRGYSTPHHIVGGSKLPVSAIQYNDMKNQVKRKVNQVKLTKEQGCLLIDNLAADFDVKKAKQIRPFDLRDLGYIISVSRKVIIKGTPYELRIILDADTKREVGFCMLLSTKTNNGIIMPHPFSYYIEQLSVSPEII